MKLIGFFLIVIGLLGLGIGMVMFGDIGIAAIIGSLVGLLTGIGFWRLPGFVKRSLPQGGHQ